MKHVLKAILVLHFLIVSGHSWAKPTILTSIKPLALITQDLVGDLATVEVLLASNTDPHHYALKVSDRRRLQTADLIVWSGPTFERFLVKPLANVNELKKFAAANLLNTNNKTADPHQWLSPTWAMQTTRELAAKLAIIFPEWKDQIESRLESRIAELQTLETTMKSELAMYQGLGFIADHSAYGALQREFGLVELGAIEQHEDIGPSAQHLAKLSQLVMEQHPRCIFVSEGNQNNRAVLRWSERWELPIITMDLLGVDPTIKNYHALMATVSAAIKTCFTLEKR